MLKTGCDTAVVVTKAVPVFFVVQINVVWSLFLIFMLGP
jgi:hypothetical protein